MKDGGHEKEGLRRTGLSTVNGAFVEEADSTGDFIDDRLISDHFDGLLGIEMVVVVVRVRSRSGRIRSVFDILIKYQKYVLHSSSFSLPVQLKKIKELEKTKSFSLSLCLTFCLPFTFSSFDRRD